MKISLDASLLLYPNWSGVQVYTYRVLEAMTRLAAEDDRFVLHCDQTVRNAGMDLLEGRKNVTRLDRPGNMRYHALLPIDTLARRSQIYYSFSGRIKTPLACPTALTVFDNGRYVIPEYYGVTDAATVAAEREQQGKFLRAPAALITISETVKAEIIDLFGVSPGKIFVVPTAAERDDPSLADQRPGELAERGQDGYILMVNPGRPYKNWADAIAGFARYVAENPSDTETRLVFAGELRGEDEPIRRACAAVGPAVASRIHLLGYVSDGELRYLYRHARVVVLPSLYEGFGIPALEAMCYDVPLIVSDIPVLREVAGDAALRVALGDPEALSDAYRRLLADVSLRGEMIARGRRRAADFSWSRSGQQTLDILKRLAHGRPAWVASEGAV